MKYVTLAKHAIRSYGTDKIYEASRKAKEAVKVYGHEMVINATLGECLDNEGRLMVLPTVERLFRNMPVEELCSYAPIGGILGFNEAIQISLFGQISNNFFVESVPTPGGCGALRHAIWNFLDDGDSTLTTDWYWGPYKAICEEHGRHLEVFSMFDEKMGFYYKALEQAVEKLIKTQEQMLIILNTPASNPTGYSMTEEDMNQVVEIVNKIARQYPDKKITLCLDVSYIDYDDTFENTRKVFNCVKNMSENTMTLVIFSMSKSYTMCGMRCGALVCLGKTKEAAELFKQAMSYSSRAVWSNVVRVAQKVLVDICTSPELRQQVEEERGAFRSIITERGETFYHAAKQVGLECCPYKHGYFIAIPCSHPDAVAEYLCSKNVFVVPLTKGLRFSPCAVTIDKCLKAPIVIKKAIKLLEENHENN